MITRCGTEHECDSVINLAWYNEAAICRTTFSDLRVDWEGSLGSDHAMLHVTGQPTGPTPFSNSTDPTSFLLDPEQKPIWIQEFKGINANQSFSTNPSAEEVERAATDLTSDIQSASEASFHKRHLPHHRASLWWNAACALAAQQMWEAQGWEAKSTAHACLRGMVRAAKRNWADEHIQEAQLWDVAKWRHGRQLTKVPPLRKPEGMAHSHEELTEILAQRFFTQTPPEVPEDFDDDPALVTPRSRPVITRALVDELLHKVSNRSAPGQTGHSWTLIKWTWEARPERLRNLLEACLKAGHHPRAWKEAIVCVIPKPNRADYSLAKNFRPIALLECLGKLLEKVVARLIHRDLTHLPLVPTMQFGGRNCNDPSCHPYFFLDKSSCHLP